MPDPAKKKNKKKKAADPAGPDLSSMTPQQRKRYRKQKAKEAKKAKANEAAAASAAADPNGPGANELRVNEFIPDSSLGERAFNDKAQYYLDDARLDPTRDTTLQPMIDAMQRESAQDYQTATADLQLQAEGGSRFGDQYYQAALGRAQDQFAEAQSATLANLYAQEQNRGEDLRMSMLGLGNQRDTAAGELAMQKYAADRGVAAARISAAPGMASVNLQRTQWNEEAPIRYLQAMQGFIGTGNTQGGYSQSVGYVPGVGPDLSPSNASIVLGGLAAGAGTYMKYGKGYLGQNPGQG
jgi:hypothetical protein